MSTTAMPTVSRSSRLQITQDGSVRVQVKTAQNQMTRSTTVVVVNNDTDRTIISASASKALNSTKGETSRPTKDSKRKNHVVFSPRAATRSMPHNRPLLMAVIRSIRQSRADRKLMSEYRASQGQSSTSPPNPFEIRREALREKAKGLVHKIEIACVHIARCSSAMPASLMYSHEHGVIKVLLNSRVMAVQLWLKHQSRTLSIEEGITSRGQQGQAA